MKQNSHLLKFIGFLFVAAITISGCKENGIVESVPVGQTSSEDAATMIAPEVADSTGGVIDIIGDISQFATVGGSLSRSNGTEIFVTTFSDSSKKWSGTLTRSKGTAPGQYYSSIIRTYEWQYTKDTVVFINDDPLRPKDSILVKLDYTTGIAGRDTANKITVTLVNGTANAITPQYRHQTTSITGIWNVTKVNTDTLTINGTISAAAVDDLLTRDVPRTLTNQESISVTNFRLLRGNRTTITSFANTITGSYSAVVTFPQGQQQYSDLTIKNNFSVKIHAGTINVGGMIFNSNLVLGTLN